ncbi:MAG: hypothetical protein Tsb0032_26970 [Kiloniellaceae bacterium]
MLKSIRAAEEERAGGRQTMFLRSAARRTGVLPPVLRNLGLGSLLFVAACDEGPSTITHYMHPSGSFDFLIAATKNEGPLYLEIDGMPFAEETDLEGRVAAVMENAVQTRVLQLTTDQAEAEDPRFRLVLVFNPANSGEVFAFCQDQPQGGPARDDQRIELRAGFCRGDDLLAAVDGWAEEVERPGDEKFEQLMRQVARDLLSRNRNDN